MDRLEKALIKAREQREMALTDTQAAVSDVPSPPTESPTAQVAEKPATSLTRQVRIDDGTLERSRIVARLNRDANADIFRILRTKVLQEMIRSGLKTIAVTSPNYGDGKTTIAVNLAVSLALDLKQTVLLVDLDLRSPSIHTVLDIDPTVGLSDYFLHNAPVADCLIKPAAFDRLVVLPISKPLDNSSEMLASPKMAALAQELRNRYSDRIVIYDMPPVLSQDDTIAFLPHVDGVLMVVRDGTTRSEDITHCLNTLGEANLLGTVLNNSSGTVTKRK